jgi:hypothetical protein
MADAATGTRAHGRGGRQWLRVFLGGLLLWAASVVVTFWTGNANLVPTVILLGSFLVPVTFVVYAFQRYADQVLTTQRIFTAFLYGGAVGVLGASILEAEFLKQPSGLTYVGVGLIEEAVKLAALWLVALRLRGTRCGTGSCSAPPSASGSPPWRAPGTPSTRCSPWRDCRCRTWSRPRSCVGC